ncbi:hypothetical protein NliqN6_4849 [Naganishia liquefaciens]|uniref:Poly(A) RNA polymerase mitochondrial-like central palm domain-containing protein n=1 Tax=Naganishia liquefaciens TaxID=104408 RepID=A0A8H3TWI5_9TREE|nr:hypothetical protein NliqN6_4849 [Naganishia liquefaciens]
MEVHPDPTPTPSTVEESETKRNRRKRNPAKNYAAPINGQTGATSGATSGEANHGSAPRSVGRRQLGRTPRVQRPAKLETLQLGPLDSLSKQGLSTQDLARATLRQNAEKNQFKIPASQRLAQNAIAVATARAHGDPLTILDGQSFDGQHAAAAIARNPAHLAGIHGAKTDRRPGYLRAQNMPAKVSQKISAGAPGGTSAPGAFSNQNDSWRRRPDATQNARAQPQIRTFSGQSRSNAAPVRSQVANIAGTRFENPATNMREVIEMLDRVPNPWPSTTQPFLSAYRYTLTHPDSRSQIPVQVLDSTRHSALSAAILESWRASEPSQANRETVARIVNQVNAVFRERYGKRFDLVIEPFGSVSWGGETGDTADVDMTLKDFARPFGYTRDLWPKNERDRLDFGPIYNVYALSRLLNEAGYIDVEPIKWANTPIVKFKDPTSGVSLDLNTNDLGGEANSRMILAYCRLAPFSLRPLIHTVKTWAKSRNLNDSSGAKGSPTLSSYCWTLMSIAYMQIIGKLPNLQDAVSVRAAGREDCVIWVSWGKPQGQAANIGFAEPCEDGLAAAAAREDDVGSIVKGFFAFYHTMFRDDREPADKPLAIYDGRVPSTRHHVISVWKGGLTNRSTSIDASSSSKRRVDKQKGQARGGDAVISGLEQNEQTTIEEEVENANVQEASQTLPNERDNRGARAKGRNRFLPAEELARGPPVDGFAQPQRWAKAELVVQDPFLHDKNCAVALLKPNFERITRELERAVDILEGGESLNILFEKADPRESISRRRKARLQKQERQEQKLAHLKVTKAVNQS